MFNPRTALLDGDLKTLRFYGQTAKWTDIYIRDDPISASTLSLAVVAACLRAGDEFNLKRYLWLSQLLRVNSHFHFAWDSLGPLLRRGYPLTLFQPRRGTVVLELKETTHPGIWIALGRCPHANPEDIDPELPTRPHWARLILHPYGTDPLQSAVHDCENDHVRAWPGMARTFKYHDSLWILQRRAVVLPCPGRRFQSPCLADQAHQPLARGPLGRARRPSPRASISRFGEVGSISLALHM
ncbi:hypothetical protein LXA43DRAFT_1010687, partial [Ganoderma leucocontextum]